MAPVILLVEDDPGDRLIQKHLFQQAAPRIALRVVEDGERAIEALSGAETPSVVLLDLSLPRRDGFEVLRWIRARLRPEELPVIVHTVSDDARDIRRAYALGANSYVVKCVDLDERRRLARGVAAFAELSLESRSISRAAAG